MLAGSKAMALPATTMPAGSRRQSTASNSSVMASVRRRHHIYRSDACHPHQRISMQAALLLDSDAVTRVDMHSSETLEHVGLVRNPPEVLHQIRRVKTHHFCKPNCFCKLKRSVQGIHLYVKQQGGWRSRSATVSEQSGGSCNAATSLEQSNQLPRGALQGWGTFGKFCTGSVQTGSE